MLAATISFGLLLALGGMLQAAPFTTAPDPAVRFGVHELAFTGSGGAADPFATAATVTVTPPSGARRTVEMFWDGGNSWRARVYVSEAGAWSWASSCAGDPGLNGKTGSFRAGESSLRGLLKPHPANPRALATDDGRWFAPIGDTAYFLLGSSNYLDYVRDDWARGVNFLRCSAFGQLRRYDSHFDAEGRPNLASLQADDAKVKNLFTQYPGVYLQYILFPENASNKWASFSTAAKTGWLQQVVARFGAFPTITWQIMNDSAYPAANTGDTAVAATVAAFLEAHDGYGHLRGTGARRGKGAPFADRAWTTFLHHETKDALGADEADRPAAPGKFTWCGEDRYETYLPPAHPRYFFRRLMWAWILSGGSACYGGDWDSTTPYALTGFTGLDSVAFIGSYFESRGIDLALFSYNDKRARDPASTGKNRPQACNRGMEEFIVYHPNGTGEGAGVDIDAGRTASFELDLSGAPGPFQVEWFRARDGVRVSGGTVPGGALRVFTAPWAGQDVVCRLERSGS
jgi:hypothetical protein